jgi:hypothetical protein
MSNPPSRGIHRDVPQRSTGRLGANCQVVRWHKGWSYLAVSMEVGSAGMSEGSVMAGPWEQSDGWDWSWGLGVGECSVASGKVGLCG